MVTRRNTRTRRITLGGALAAALLAASIYQASVPGHPIVFTGRVSTRPAGSGAQAVPPDSRVRVDVYLIPIDPIPMVLLAHTFTKRDGTFQVKADPPVNLAFYADRGGLVKATIVYSDMGHLASRLGHEQLRWAGDRWERLTPDDDARADVMLETPIPNSDEP